jgi:adenylate cyclase
MDPVIETRCCHAYALWMLGHTERASATMHDLLEEVTQPGVSPVTAAGALVYLAMLELFQQNPVAVERLAGTVRVLAAEHGFRFWGAIASAMNGWARVHQGDVRAGIEELEAARNAHAESMAHVASTHIAAFLAEAYLRAGEPTAGLAAVDDGLRMAEATLDRTYWPELCRIKGELLLARATAEQPRAAQRHRANLQSDEAERCLMRALELARQMEAKSLELRAATSLARAWQASGRGAEAYALLDPVCSWFGADATSPDLLDARQLLRELPASSPSGGNTARAVIPEDAPPSPPRAGRHRRR